MNYVKNCLLKKFKKLDFVKSKIFFVILYKKICYNLPLSNCHHSRSESTGPMLKYVSLCMCMCVRIYERVYICVHACACVYESMCVCLCVPMCLYVCKRMYVCVCVFERAYMWIICVTRVALNTWWNKLSRVGDLTIFWWYF